MGSYFHGNGETISFLAEMLAGGEQEIIFHSLYRPFTESCVDRNGAINAMQKKLKRIFHRSQTLILILVLKSRPTTLMPERHQAGLIAGAFILWLLKKLL